ncbi:hypothetical protein NMY22_g10390 [Coprinellus aureogranulatus]|nr:hypothetical protein NMY22_g10390 [Coprinellus aureogranulatus]
MSTTRTTSSASTRTTSSASTRTTSSASTHTTSSASATPTQPRPPTRRVRVDDTNPSVIYNGPWTGDGWQSYPTWRPGDPFLASLHGLGQSTSVSFEYEGIYVSVYGYLNGVSNLNWQCRLEDGDPKGEVLGAMGVSSRFQHDTFLCGYSTGETDAGRHKLTFNVLQGSNQSIWLDYIEYAPTTPNTRYPYVSLSATDPAIVYDRSWRPHKDGYDYTNTTGSGPLTFVFNGTGVDWYGYLPEDMLSEWARCAYRIDGRDYTRFDIGNPEPNPLFFSTEDLPYGTHNLTVYYLEGEFPLSIHHLIVRDSSANAPSTNVTDSSPTSFDSPPGSTSTTPRGSPKPSSGMIAGAVIGGLTAVGLIVIIFTFRRRWHRRRALAEANISVREPFTPPLAARPPTSAVGGILWSKARPTAPVVASHALERGGRAVARAALTPHSKRAQAQETAPLDAWAHTTEASVPTIQQRPLSRIEPHSPGSHEIPSTMPPPYSTLRGATGSHPWLKVMRNTASWLARGWAVAPLQPIKSVGIGDFTLYAFFKGQIKDFSSHSAKLSHQRATSEPPRCSAHHFFARVAPVAPRKVPNSLAKFYAALESKYLAEELYFLAAITLGSKQHKHHAILNLSALILDKLDLEPPSPLHHCTTAFSHSQGT